jgi:hypothetical protein
LKRLEVRYLERLPLGMAYTAVAARISQMVWDQRLRGQVTAVVDATGVGAPVVDLLRAGQVGCEVVPVSITGGERVTRNGAVWNVPKQDLIAGMSVLMENGQLRIARGLRDAGALVKEMADMRRVQRESGRERLGAEGSGEHDDLVIAVSLGCWKARQRGIGFGPARLL